jgi:hypothetical protein
MNGVPLPVPGASKGQAMYARREDDGGERRFQEASADSDRWTQGLRSRLLSTLEGVAMRGASLICSGLQCAERPVHPIQAWIPSSKSLSRSLSPEVSSQTVHPVPFRWID